MRRVTIVAVALLAGLFALNIAAAQAAVSVPCLVPNLRGDDLATARVRLLEDHCLLGKITILKKGSALGVVKQTPAAGRLFKHRTKVTVGMLPNATRPRALILWCTQDPTTLASYDDNCSGVDNPTLGNPPDPVHTKPGQPLYFDANAIGSQDSDPTPTGYLHFVITGPTADHTTSSVDELGDLQAGCGKIYDDSGDANGLCTVTFNKPGVYVLAVGFTDTDRTYGNILVGPFVTVVVS